MSQAVVVLRQLLLQHNLLLQRLVEHHLLKLPQLLALVVVATQKIQTSVRIRPMVITYILSVINIITAGIVVKRRLNLVQLVLYGIRPLMLVTGLPMLIVMLRQLLVVLRQLRYQEQLHQPPKEQPEELLEQPPKDPLKALATVISYESVTLPTGHNIEMDMVSSINPKMFPLIFALISFIHLPRSLKVKIDSSHMNGMIFTSYIRPQWH